MSHQFVSGMFVRVPAWHKLGTVIQHKVYSSEEALQLAGADWNASLRIMEVDGIEVPGVRAVQRDDTKEIIGVVGKRYVIKQNRDAFKFFDPFLHEQDCYIDTAGVLNGGSKVWILAKIENNEKEVEGDVVDNYLLLANSHDGTLKLTVKFVSVRVVCANTLQSALKQSGAFKGISHTSSMDLKLSEVQSSIDIVKKTFDRSILMYREMANSHITTEQFRSYLESLFTDDLAKASKRLDRTAKLEDIRACKKILHSYDYSADLQVNGVRGTAWGAYNAVTEYISHTKSSNTDNRYNSIWFGKDAKFLDEAAIQLYALDLV